MLLRSQEGGRMAFWCPACNEAHWVRVGDRGWSWNGSLDKPTFTPSVLVTGRDFTPRGEADFQAWHVAGCPKPAPEFESAETCCHSYVTDGRIQFLTDCKHAMGGQTVDLLPWPTGENT